MKAVGRKPLDFHPAARQGLRLPIDVDCTQDDPDVPGCSSSMSSPIAKGRSDSDRCILRRQSSVRSDASDSHSDCPPQPTFLTRSQTAPPVMDQRQRRLKVSDNDWRFDSLDDVAGEVEACASMSLSRTAAFVELDMENDESVDEMTMICTQVQQHPACHDLDAMEINRIVDSMRHFTFPAERTLARQGDRGQYFFIIVDGALDVYVDGKAINTLGRGESFGGDSLLYGGLQWATVVANEETRAWGIDGATFRAILMGMAQKQHAENFKLLDGAEIFLSLSADQKAQLSKIALFIEARRAGDRIVNEGEVAVAVYFIKEGAVNVVVDGNLDAASNFVGGEVVRHLQAGDCFGKQAALTGRPALATFVAATDCRLVCMGIDQMKAVLGTDIAAGLEGSVLSQCLEKSHFISQFSLRERRRIVKAMKMINLQPNEPLEGELELIAVVSGSVYRQDDPAELILEAGDFRQTARLTSAGQTSAMVRKRSFRTSTSGSISMPPEMPLDGLSNLVAGEEGARIGTLTQDSLANALREAGISSLSTEAIEHARRMLLARKVPLFHHLSVSQIDSLVESFIFVSLKQGEVVCERGSAARDFWVIAKGEVEEVIPGHAPTTIGKNGHFGLRGLLLNKARPGTVRVSSPTAEFWQLEQETFNQIVTGNIREELEQRIRVQHTKVRLKDLAHVKLIGQGGFGCVRLVEHAKERKCRYALKRVIKESGKRGDKILEMLRAECALLRELDHPLIMLCIETFETERSMYILSELISGGDLLAALDSIQRLLRQSEVQFYVGSLILVLEFLCDRCIVYRDLKPENVLLDHQGYLKLIDFGTAKKLDGYGGRTFTVIGSYQFMAPEVSQSIYKLSKSTGYGTGVDVWSLGVMMYEFVCGFLPFGHNVINDPSGKKVIKEVHEKNLEFPKWCVDRNAKHLMRGMMRKDPAQRMGAGEDGFSMLREHEYFKMDDPNQCLFNMILTRQVEAPFVSTSESYQIEDDDGIDKQSDKDELCAEKDRPRRNSNPATPEVDDDLMDARRALIRRKTTGSLSWNGDTGRRRSISDPCCADATSSLMRANSENSVDSTADDYSPRLARTTARKHSESRPGGLKASLKQRPLTPEEGSPVDDDDDTQALKRSSSSGYPRQASFSDDVIDVDPGAIGRSASLKD